MIWTIILVCWLIGSVGSCVGFIPVAKGQDGEIGLLILVFLLSWVVVIPMFYFSYIESYQAEAYAKLSYEMENDL